MLDLEEFFYGINKSLYYKTEDQKNVLKKTDPDYLTRTYFLITNQKGH